MNTLLKTLEKQEADQVFNLLPKKEASLRRKELEKLQQDIKKRAAKKAKCAEANKIKMQKCERWQMGNETKWKMKSGKWKKQKWKMMWNLSEKTTDVLLVIYNTFRSVFAWVKFPGPPVHCVSESEI